MSPTPYLFYVKAPSEQIIHPLIFRTYSLSLKIHLALKSHMAYTLMEGLKLYFISNVKSSTIIIESFRRILLDNGFFYNEL